MFCEVQTIDTLINNFKGFLKTFEFSLRKFQLT